MSTDTYTDAKAVETLRARLALVGWGLARDGAAFVAYRVSSSRACAALRDAEQLAIALECHARAAGRQGAPDGGP